MACSGVVASLSMLGSALRVDSPHRAMAICAVLNSQVSPSEVALPGAD
jgi:hypothetical protein